MNTPLMSSPRICNRPQMHHPVQSSITLCPPSGLLLSARLSRDCPASARFDFQRCQLPDYWPPPHPTPPHPTRQSASIQFRVHTISSHSSPMQPLAAWRQLHRLRSQRADFWICWMLLGFLCGGPQAPPARSQHSTTRCITTVLHVGLRLAARTTAACSHSGHRETTSSAPPHTVTLSLPMIGWDWTLWEGWVSRVGVGSDGRLEWVPHIVV